MSLGISALALDENRLYLLVMPNTKPLLTAAFLCEQVLVEKDGVVTAVRIVDRLSIDYHTDQPDIPAIPFQLTFLVMVKSGSLKGRWELSLRIRTPTDKIIDTVKHQVELKGEEQGANWILKLTMPVRGSGLYWFDVYAAEELLTSVPLRITLTRLTEKPQRG